MRPGLLALLAAVVLSTHDASAEDPPELVGQLDGRPVAAGLVVEVPRGKNQNLVLDVSGAEVTLRPGSTVVLSSPQWFQPETIGKTIRGSRLFLRAGQISVRLRRNQTNPSAVSVALGGGQQSVLLWHGAARVIAHDGDLSAAIDDGAGVVSAQDQWLRMNGGSAALLPKKAPPQLYKQHLDAPVLTSSGDGDLGVAFGAEKRTVRVRWGAVTGADAYQVEIATDEAMSQIAFATNVPKATLVSEQQLSPGTYWAHVVATATEAFQSMPSAPRAIRVVKATLPQNAFVTGDVVVMPANASLTVDAARLTFATGAGNDTASALAGALAATLVASPAQGSSSFALGGHRARVVRLHHASGAEGRISLVARELRASVDMQPARARWPSDPIDATVVLEDPSKRIDVASEPVTLEVAVDARPVPATWTRTGATFRARIAPIDGPGPFFVRVVARDKSGAEIGGRVIDIDGRVPLEPRPLR